MINMCIPISRCMHPDPICSSETLISASRKDPILLTPPLPFASADHRGKQQSELKQDPYEVNAVEEHVFRGGGEEVSEEKECNGGGEKILEEDHNFQDCESDYLYCSEPRINCQSQHPPSPPPVGAGLENMGNTCFLNAVLQCFTHTVPLVHGLHSLYDYGVPRHHNEGEFCVLSAVRDHVFQALNAPGEVISPGNLVFNLNHISSFLHRYQQEDAHEFLQCLLDKTDTCWSKCKANMEGYSSPGDSLVKRVFGGRLVSQLHCCNCGNRSDTYEAMVDLSLEIEHADDLNGALKSFTKMEENEDEVKFTCEKCKQKVPLKKQLLIDQAPSVATLHLKRFKGDWQYVEKIDKVLEYPLELDLKPYTVASDDENVREVDLTYELYGVIVHRGFSSTSGHYLSYIRSSPDVWFRIDDSKITRVREEAALSQQGYILFYAKKGTAWPSSLFKSSSDPYILKSSPTSVLENVQKPLFNPQIENSNVNMQMEAEQHQLPYQQDDEPASTEPSTAPPPSKDHEVAADEEFVPTTVPEENDVMSQCFKSRSPSPDVYDFSPEACNPRPLKKKKVVKCVTPPSKGMSLKMREAQRLMRRMPSSRRRNLMSAALNKRHSF